MVQCIKVSGVATAMAKVAAAAQIRILAQELPYASHVAKKKEAI